MKINSRRNCECLVWKVGEGSSLFELEGGASGV